MESRLSPWVPVWPSHQNPVAMEKQLPASLSRQHSVNALMREREEVVTTSPPPSKQRQQSAGDEEDEKTPLLQEKRDTADVSTKKGWNLRILTLVVVLWIAGILMSSCYSMIAPFFPKEVSFFSLKCIITF